MKSSVLKYFLLASGLLLLLILLFLSPPDTWSIELSITLGWLAMVTPLLWLGNRFITRWMDRSLTWFQYGKWRFLAQLALILIYSLGIVNGVYYLLKLNFTNEPPIFEQVVVMNVYGTFIVILISSIYFLFYFIQAWISSKVESERLQKEAVRTQLNVLRNHLDPHFLFNNLNILSALIDKDRDRSQDFLGKFTEVYRVLLKTETQELITLRQELEFVEAYLHLIRIRFGDLFSIEMEIDEACKNLFLPPLTLQMLVENGLKHNQMTESQPLKMHLICEGNWLVIQNALLPKKDKGPHSGSGLNNLMERYKILSDELPQIRQSKEYFEVRIPLISVNNYENSDF